MTIELYTLGTTPLCESNTIVSNETATTSQEAGRKTSSHPLYAKQAKTLRPVSRKAYCKPNRWKGERERVGGEGEKGKNSD